MDTIMRLYILFDKESQVRQMTAHVTSANDLNSHLSLGTNFAKMAKGSPYLLTK